MLLQIQYIGYPKSVVVIVVSILFGFAHIVYFLRLYKKSKIGSSKMTFIDGASLLGSILFINLILFVPYGIVYSFALHNLYYTILSATKQVK